ncbi:hypothetical protein OUZ56_026686 [Daphnia magna]|uniref:Uncharacterized protein n=1 Tax=Daphnia magna TaxID=35525 RepID=A0ABQ9ZMQ2_9CRUS|nr:hypothetical protein OUZ56_026686 [Daphnia magna]
MGVWEIKGENENRPGLLLSPLLSGVLWGIHNHFEEGLDQIKCPHFRRLTPVSAGWICMDVDLHTDHDFLALVQNLQQHAVGPTPGGSGAISKREKATDIPSSEKSTSA